MQCGQRLIGYASTSTWKAGCAPQLAWLWLQNIVYDVFLAAGVLHIAGNAIVLVHGHALCLIRERREELGSEPSASTVLQSCVYIQDTGI